MLSRSFSRSRLCFFKSNSRPLRLVFESAGLLEISLRVLVNGCFDVQGDAGARLIVFVR